MEIQMWENTGHLMTGSGLDAILKLIYAENTVPHTSGTAYSRGDIRGLLLITASLYGYIMSNVYGCHIIPTTIDVDQVESEEGKTSEVLIDISSSEQDFKDISALLDKVIVEDGELPNEVEKYQIDDHLMKVENLRQNLQHQTAQLWFLDMTEIARKSIKAACTGNWQLHLQSVSEMLPYFAASGHYLNFKSAYLYL